jgi:hypothetical protein
MQVLRSLLRLVGGRLEAASEAQMRTVQITGAAHFVRLMSISHDTERCDTDLPHKLGVSFPHKGCCSGGFTRQ